MTCSQKYAFFLISAVIAIVYSNSFYADWHFDDLPNVCNNESIRISEINVDSLSKVMHANPINGERLIRPVAFLTFALNWYFGRQHVFSYHLFNILVHMGCALFLFMSISSLLNAPVFAGKYIENKCVIALLASLIWAMHPIQVQAVTYIVQRMASLSTLFYIIGIYFYLRLKETSSKIKQYIFVAAIILAYILALGTKENAVTLPVSILLMEIIFYQDIRDRKTKKIIGAICAAAIVIMLLLSIFVFNKEIFSILKDYEYRPFTLKQRLLTQPRIVSFYLKQLVLPVNDYLSIAHDVPLSTSFFHPWTTFPAIIFIAGFLATGLSQIIVRPTVAFATLFFLLNHIVESTIIPLELIFEHRNYLPSMFLFLPVAVGIIFLIQYYREKSAFIAWVVVSFVFILIFGMGSGTYTRNFAWATQASLWMDAMKKAPNNPRPYQNLADIYNTRGNYQYAMLLYQKSLYLPEISKDSISKSLNNIGNIYNRLNQKETAVSYYQQALAAFGENRLAQLNLASALINLGEYEEAMKHAAKLTKQYPKDIRFLNLYGFLLLKNHQLPEAIACLRNGLALDPADRHILINIAMALSHYGSYKNANFFLIKAIHYYPDDINSYFSLLENLSYANDKNKSDQLLTLLFKKFSVTEIHTKLAAAASMKTSVPYIPELVAEIIAKRVSEFGNVIN